MVRGLDLFSGTESFKKCCISVGWECISLDKFDKRADLQLDIMDWNYKKLPPKYFDIIWASPPCENYSNLKYIWSNKEEVSKLWDEADKLVMKAIEIIEYFQPAFWYIENPHSGELRKRPCMKNKFYYKVDYCKYADWGYRKRTCIWTNRKGFKPQRCNKDCNSFDNITNRHYTDVSYQGNNIDKRHRIPPELIYQLIL